MHRLYIENVSGQSVTISDAEQLHYLRDVLRLKANDEVVLFDNTGSEYTCSITQLDPRQAVLQVKTIKRNEGKGISMTVACAIPKKGKFDEIIDNLTQLGVDNIVPLETERVVVRLEPLMKETRLERWRRIARNAAQQSLRSTIPTIEPIDNLGSLITRSTGFDLKLLPTLLGETKHIKDVLAESMPAKVIILIGPEGDFTSGEVELARNAGFIPVSLGDSVLRVSTAAIATVSYVKLYYNG